MPDLLQLKEPNLDAEFLAFDVPTRCSTNRPLRPPRLDDSLHAMCQAKFVANAADGPCWRHTMCPDVNRIALAGGAGKRLQQQGGRSTCLPDSIP